MVNIIIREFELPEVSFNEEEISKQLDEYLKKYKGLVFVDEDELKDAKSIRAEMNKVKKLLDDERKKVKKELSAPISAFEDKIKKLVQKVDEVNSDIDIQVKKFEEELKEKKKKEIEEMFSEVDMKKYDIQEYEITFPDIFEQQWLNQSVSLHKVGNEMTNKLKDIQKDIMIIKQKDDGDDWIEKYFKYFDMDLERTLHEYEHEKMKTEARKEEEKEIIEKQVSSDYIINLKMTEYEKDKLLKFLEREEFKFVIVLDDKDW